MLGHPIVQKADNQGTNFAKEFSPWNRVSENSIRLRTDWEPPRNCMPAREHSADCDGSNLIFRLLSLIIDQTQTWY